MLKAQKDGDGDSVAKAAKRAFSNTFPHAHLDRVYRPTHCSGCHQGKVAQA
jgi:hypothetical protein